jgi:dTDP-4-dehydrorhamnose reductase
MFAHLRHPRAGTLLITGASGLLGAHLLRQLAAEGEQAVAWSGTRGGELFGFPLRPVDLTDADAVAEAFRAARPAAVIHAAALARIADCAREPERARSVNALATARLAELCAAAGARLAHVSTDLVFDGERAPYRESDEPTPLSAYGRAKAEGERAVLAHPGHCVARLSLLYGPSLTGRSFFDEQVSALRAGRPVKLFTDEWRTPLDLPTAARALLELAGAEVSGVLHLGGPERLSRHELGLLLAEALGADPALVVPARRQDVPAAEPRPRDTSLDSSRWRGLFPGLPWPTCREALREMLS